MLILTRKTIDELLTVAMQAATGALAGPLNTAHIALATTGPAPTPDVALADYTECTFAGYARKTLATPGTAFDSANRVKVVYPAVQFQPTDASIPETVGYILWVDAATGGNLLAVIQLPNPAPMGNNQDALVYVPEFGYDLDWEYADGTIVG